MNNISANNSDFGGFLRYLDDEECFDFESIVQVVEAPSKWQSEYNQFQIHLKVKEGEGTLLEGYVSDCCLGEVVKFDSKTGDDFACIDCFKGCLAEEDDEVS